MYIYVCIHHSYLQLWFHMLWHFSKDKTKSKPSKAQHTVLAGIRNQFSNVTRPWCAASHFVTTATIRERQSPVLTNVENNQVQWKSRPTFNSIYHLLRLNVDRYITVHINVSYTKYKPPMSTFPVRSSPRSCPAILGMKSLPNSSARV